MKTRTCEIVVTAPNEVTLTLACDGASMTRRYTADETSLLACELASASIEARHMTSTGSNGRPMPSQTRPGG